MCFREFVKLKKVHKLACHYPHQPDHIGCGDHPQHHHHHSDHFDLPSDPDHIVNADHSINTPLSSPPSYSSCM